MGVRDRVITCGVLVTEHPPQLVRHVRGARGVHLVEAMERTARLLAHLLRARARARARARVMFSPGWGQASGSAQVGVTCSPGWSSREVTGSSSAGSVSVFTW